MKFKAIDQDIDELDVFLAAYSQWHDNCLLANVIHPEDDLLTMGVLRRILAHGRAKDGKK